MNERIKKAVDFLGKCEVLGDTEEYHIATALREQAMWARVKFNEYCRVGFSPRCAFMLLQAEISSPSIEIYRGDEDEGDS